MKSFIIFLLSVFCFSGAYAKPSFDWGRCVKDREFVKYNKKMTEVTVFVGQNIAVQYYSKYWREVEYNLSEIVISKNGENKVFLHKENKRKQKSLIGLIEIKEGDSLSGERIIIKVKKIEQHKAVFEIKVE